MMHGKLAEDRRLMGRLGATLGLACLIPWVVTLTHGAPGLKIRFAWEVAAEWASMWWLFGAFSVIGVLMVVLARLRNLVDDRSALIAAGCLSATGLLVVHFLTLDAFRSTSQAAPIQLGELSPISGILGLALLVLLGAGARLRMENPTSKSSRILLAAPAILLLLGSFWPQQLVDLNQVDNLSRLQFAKETTSAVPWFHNFELIGVLLDMDEPAAGSAGYMILLLLWNNSGPVVAILALVSLRPRSHEKASDRPETLSSDGLTAEPGETTKPQQNTQHNNDSNPTAPQAVRWWSTLYIPVSLCLLVAMAVGKGVLLIAFVVLAVAIGTWVALSGHAIQLALSPTDAPNITSSAER